MSFTSPPVIWDAPSITLIAETGLTLDGMRIMDPLTSKSYRGPHSNSERLIEFSGRNCYQSFHNPKGRSNREYNENIINLKHFSVLEHANATFFLEGVSRSFTHELIRHRHHSYSQLSQRYVDQSSLGFVLPPLYRSDHTLREGFEERMRCLSRQLTNQYKLVSCRHPNLSKKQIREAVRAEAPNCIETKIVVTGNMRAWREFLEKRWSDGAEAEIAEVAGIICDKLKSRYNSLFSDIERQT